MKFRKLLLLNLLFICLVAAVISLVYMYFQDPASQLNQALVDLFRLHDQQAFDIWQEKAITALGSGFAKLSTAEQFRHFDTLAAERNKHHLIPIKLLHVTTAEQFQTELELEYAIVDVDVLPADVIVVIQQGQNEITNTIKLTFNETEALVINLANIQNAVIEISHRGRSEVNAVEALLAKMLDDVKLHLRDKQWQKLNTFTDFGSEGENVLKRRPDALNMLEKTVLANASWEAGVANSLSISLTIKQEGCNLDHRLVAKYLPELRQYTLQGVPRYLLDLCNQDGVVPLTCENCWLAPLDKMHQLTPKYIPEVVDTNLLGGGRLIPEAATALRSLFADAEAAGAPAKVFSSYRSYQDQVGAFDYWYKRELARGLPPAQAKVSANKYSAYPGHSEHQLGTTVDVGCDTCDAFDNSIGNIKLYDFIAKNAHKYGFVVSYAYGTTQYTGYNYEPWHIRYVGKDLAAQLFDSGYTRGSGTYLAQLLIQKQQY